MAEFYVKRVNRKFVDKNGNVTEFQNCIDIGMKHLEETGRYDTTDIIWKTLDGKGKYNDKRTMNIILRDEELISALEDAGYNVGYYTYDDNGEECTFRHLKLVLKMYEDGENNPEILLKNANGDYIPMSIRDLDSFNRKRFTDCAIKVWAKPWVVNGKEGVTPRIGMIRTDYIRDDFDAFFDEATDEMSDMPF